MSIGSFRVAKAMENIVTLRVAGRTLGPYWRSRSRAAESVNPRHGRAAGSAANVCVTSSSDGQNRALCGGNHSMCNGPRNVGGRSTPLPAATNAHDNRVGFVGICETRNDRHRMSEFDSYLLYELAEGGISRRIYLRFSLRLNPFAFRNRPDVGTNGPDH